MLLRRNGSRFVAEVVAIFAAAAISGPLLDLGTWAIIAVIVVVWVAIAVFEYGRAHPQSRATALPRKALPRKALPRKTLPRKTLSRKTVSRRTLSLKSLPRRTRRAEAAPEPVSATEPSNDFEHVRVLTPSRPTNGDGQSGPDAAPVSEAEIAAAVAAAADAAPPTPEPGPIEPAAAEPVAGRTEMPAPSAEAEPDPVSAPEPVPVGEAAVAAAVVEAAVRADGAPPAPEPAAPQPPAEPLPVTAAPWSWNVWNLERVVRERAAANDELNYLLLYLRDYANPAGMLPPDFDALVRESFGDLLTAPS